MPTLSRCDTCSCSFRPVPGDGPMPCEFLAIGERPGETENKCGIPFQGPSGREQNENYFWLGGLRREDVYVTNAVKCFELGNRKPSEKEIRACAAQHLAQEIRDCNPSVIFLLGGTACSLVPGIDLDIEHGIPRNGELFGWEGPLIPMYHPAAGLHDTGKMIPLLEDWERVGKILRGEWFQPQDEYPNPDYGLITDLSDLRIYLQLYHPKSRQSAIDTERHGEEPFSVQLSNKPGTGRMILHTSGLMEYLSDWLDDWDIEVILHHAPQDLDWLDRMGVRINRFRDTMQEAYHLGNLPQGLKALVYRLFGIRMRTFEDVVTPHSRIAVCNWLAEAQTYSAQNLQYISQKQLKTKVKEIRKPSQLERGFSRIYQHTLKGDKYDPWDKIEELFKKEDLSEGEREFVESTRGSTQGDKVINRLMGHPGEVPILGIKNTPIAEAVTYGCSDADFTLRLALRLDELREQFHTRLDVPEGDYDK